MTPVLISDRRLSMESVMESINTKNYCFKCEFSVNVNENQ